MPAESNAKAKAVALSALLLVPLATGGCIPWGGMLPRETIVLPASDIDWQPRQLVSWQTPAVVGPIVRRLYTYHDFGQTGVVDQLQLREDGGLIVLARNGVRFLDAAGRLERTVEFAPGYASTTLFRAVDGLWVAGLHGRNMGYELHAFPLGESEPRRIWEGDRCWQLAAVDFSGSGRDSLVVLKAQDYEDDSPIWFNPPPERTAFWIVDPSSADSRLVVTDHHADRIATLDIEGDGREEVILYPEPQINAYSYPFERMSLLRGDGRLEPFWNAKRHDNNHMQRLRWQRAALGRGGYVPIRSGPAALFAKVSIYSQYLHLADAQGNVVASHRLPGDVTAHQVVGWHEIDGATIVILDRAWHCDYTYSPCGSLVLELTPEGELREIARHTAFVSATVLTPDGRLLAAENRWHRPTNMRTTFVRDYGSMRRQGK